MFYADEDYARDTQEKSTGEILGSLNVAKFDLDRLTKESKGKTLSKSEWSILEACKARVPILQAELKRRGETEPNWMYPATMFNP